VTSLFAARVSSIIFTAGFTSMYFGAFDEKYFLPGAVGFAVVVQKASSLPFND
jgi:hypothetical protein